MRTLELSVIAGFRDFGRGHANAARRNLSIAPVEISALSTAPLTRVQYPNPATANPIMLIASTSAWLRSMSASALKRRSRCSNASGTVLNDVMTEVVLIAMTTSGNCGARKNRPTGIARAQDASKPASPKSTASPFSWLSCSTLSSRTASTAVPRPNSERSVMSPR